MSLIYCFQHIFLLQNKTFAQNQKDVLMHDAKRMLYEAPLKQICIQWIDQEKKKVFNDCKDDLDKRQRAETLISELEGGKIHHGRTTDNYRRCRAPENMLIFLWLLRYMVHDDTTLNNALVFFSADTLPYVESDERNIFHPTWIKQNILLPTMDIFHLLSNENSQTNNIFMAHYGYSKPELKKRIQESIMHSMVAEIVKTIIRHGYPTTFTPGNTQQEKNINDIKSKIAEINRQNRFHVEQDLYTVFFQTIPFIIELNIDVHYDMMLQHFYKDQDFVTDKAWPEKASDITQEHTGGRKKKFNPNIDYNPTMDHFKILLPLEHEDGRVDVLTISEYFTAITVGNIPAKQLFVRPLPPTPDDPDAVQTDKGQTKRKLRNRTPVNYKGQQEQTVDDEKLESEDNGEGNKESHDKKPAAKRRKTTPKKKMPNIKSEEKIQLENDIAKNMERFEQGMAALKQNLGYDDNKHPNTETEQYLNNLTLQWELVKSQVSNYQKTE